MENSTTLEIQVSIKNVYGIETIYPECEHAKRFAMIANTKTLTPSTIHNIKALGYTIVSLVGPQKVRVMGMV